MKRIQSLLFLCVLYTAGLFAVSVKEAFKTLSEWMIMGEPLALSEIPGISNIAKEPLKSALFDKIVIASPDISGTEEEFRISGAVNMFNQAVQVVIRVGNIAQEPSGKPDSSKEDDTTWLKKTKAGKKKPVPKKTFLSKKEAIKAKVKQIKEKSAELGTKARDKAKEKTAQVMSQLQGLSAHVLIGFPDGIRLGELVPTFKFIDEIFQFSQVGFALSNDEYYEEEWGLEVQRGVTLVGAARVAGHLEKFLNKIGDGLNQFRIVGSLSPSFNLSGTYLTAELPGQLKFPGGLRSVGLRLKAMIEELQPGIPTVSVSVQTGLIVPIPNQDPLTFMTGLKVSPPKVSIAGWMEGMWNRPFGLPYFQIGELGIETGVDLVQLTSSYIPISDLGMRGKMGFGDKTIEVAINVSISAQKPDILVYGSFDGGLYLQDIINGASEVVKGFSKAAGKQINLKELTKGKIPNIGFDYVTLSLAPKDVELADKFFKKGIIFKVAGNILGTRLFFDIDISENGINAMSSISNINIADVLEITGVGPGEGPIVKLDVDPFDLKALFMIDGTVRLHVFGSPEARAQVLLMPYGGMIDVGMNFYGFGGRFAAQLDLTKPQSSAVEGELLAGAEGLEKFAKELNSLSKIILKARKPIIEAKKKISQGLQEAEQKATRDLTRAREKLSRAQKELEEKKNIFEKVRRSFSNLESEERTLQKQINECKGNVPKEAHFEIDLQIGKQQQEAQERVLKTLTSQGKSLESAYDELLAPTYQAIETKERLKDATRWITKPITVQTYKNIFSSEDIVRTISNIVHRAVQEGLSLKEGWHMAQRLEEKMHDTVMTTIANQIHTQVPLTRQSLLALRFNHDKDRFVFSRWMLNRRMEHFQKYAERLVNDTSLAPGTIKSMSDAQREYIMPLKQALETALRNYENFMKNRGNQKGIKI